MAILFLKKFFHYFKRRFKTFSIWDIKLYGASTFFLALFIASFWPRTFEQLKWAWLVLFIVMFTKPLLVLLKKETILEKIRYSK